ncbi:MAG: SRPBCC family protein [Gemmatimonadota bacterium]
MARVQEWFRLWFTFDRAVDRRAYIVSGLALVVVKYAGDMLIVWLATGRAWQVTDYFGSVGSLVWSTRIGTSPMLLPALALWALPFLWIGVSMSMRRALDAGLSAWLSLLFFVPVANYALMLGLSAWPTSTEPAATEEIPRSYEARLPKALLAIAAGALLGLGMLALSVFGLSSYGIPLFLGTPFVMGALTAFLFNRRYPASARESRQVVLMTLACVAGATLLAAAEGALCLLMAAPLGIGISLMGGALGRRIALRDSGGLPKALLAVMLLPASAAMEADRPPTALREVRSAVVIDASPEEVWRNVIQFPPLPEPSDIVFRAGIAYPQRATIVGEGVGAVRYCEFSTGAFVEPITRWEPGRRLSFDVSEQPAPMQEWSPYADISPPHIDGYFRSRRGEFRLVPLADGRTRLEGSTWYEMRLEPEAYWVLFGDALIGRIHHRVLDHIRTVTEK